MSAEPIWVSTDAVLAIHEIQIRRFGGSAGIRDAGLLESALARPQQLFCYGENVALTELGAAYAFGVVKNHPFFDGNKRTGFLAAYTFLRLNGWAIIASQEAVIENVLRLASSEMSQSQSQFATWISENISPRASESGGSK